MLSLPENPWIKLLLLPLSFIYGIVVTFRNKLFDAGILPSQECDLPVISVGNITVGGTGKTPVIEYLAGLLMDEYKVAVLSRGYKRKTKGFVLSDIHSKPHEIGDEPCQIKARYPELLVAVSENRLKGVKSIRKAHPETDIILLDDAYQHRFIKPGLSLLLIDYNRPVTKDLLMPAGRLREPVSGMSRANIILVTKCPENMKAIDRRIMVKELKVPPYQHLFFTGIEYGNFIPVFKEYATNADEVLKSETKDVILLTGIANPGPLKSFASSLFPSLTALTYPDHHDFGDADIQKIATAFYALPSENKMILTTWKDAVRLKDLQNIPEEIKKVLFFVPIKIFFLNDDQINFTKQVFNYVRGNKRNSILYKGNNKV